MSPAAARVANSDNGPIEVRHVFEGWSEGGDLSPLEFVAGKTDHGWDETRKIGMEIEWAGVDTSEGKRITRGHALWEGVSDGSIPGVETEVGEWVRGIEVRSSGKGQTLADLSANRACLRALRDAGAHGCVEDRYYSHTPQCGLHVHVDMNDQPAYIQHAACMLLTLMGEELFMPGCILAKEFPTILPAWRTEEADGYSRVMPNDMAWDTFEEGHDKEGLSSFLRGCGSFWCRTRYLSFNPCSLEEHGTIEVRVGALGDDPSLDEIFRWAGVCRDLVAIATEASHGMGEVWGMNTFDQVRDTFDGAMTEVRANLQTLLTPPKGPDSGPLTFSLGEAMGHMLATR